MFGEAADVLTRLSLACWMTRERWNTRNWRVSRCAFGTSLTAASKAFACNSAPSISARMSVTEYGEVETTLTTRFQELVIDSKCDQRYGQPAEVVLHGRGDGVNIQIGVGDVVLIVSLKASADLVDLR
jgi:hypothetical protein